MAATFGQFPDKFWFSGALLRRKRELQKTFPVLRTGTGNKKGFPAFWDWNRKSQTSIPLFGNRKNMPTAFWPFLCLTPFSSCHLLLTSNVFFTLVYHPISTCLTFTTSVASYFHKCYVSLCDCNHLLFWILPADPVFFNYFPPASVYPLTYHNHLLTRPQLQMFTSHSEYLLTNPVQSALPSNKRQRAKHFFEYFWLCMTLRPEGSRTLF